MVQLNTSSLIKGAHSKPIQSKSEPSEGQKSVEPIPKKKVGRKKTKDVKGTCKNINVAVPIVLLDKWKEVKAVHGSNLTEYVCKLIEKDMNENYDKYKELADIIKNV